MNKYRRRTGQQKLVTTQTNLDNVTNFIMFTPKPEICPDLELIKKEQVGDLKASKNAELSKLFNR